MRMISSLARNTLRLGLFSSLLLAQDLPEKSSLYVTISPVPVTTVTRGKPGIVNLHFRVASGYHVNSNKPKLEYLIPTTLKLNPPTDIVVGRITYPNGEEMSFPFAPDEKLSVYGGNFSLAVTVRPLSTVLPGKYSLRGQLRYQACDKASCYPPKSLPVDFEVKIAKAAVHKGNPAQSPHAHR